MIKSIKFKNWSCFLDEQTINVHSDDKDVLKKKINLIFGFPTSGKTAIYTILKTTIHYMKRWLLYSDDSSLLGSKNMEDIFNPNINTQNVLNSQNSTDVEIEFENETFAYKYELSFNSMFSIRESLSFKVVGVLDQWINLFEKRLIDYEVLNQKVESMYETYINIEDLELEYQPSMKGINQINSIVPFIISVSKSIIMKEFNDILEKIHFFEAKDFLHFKNFLFPCTELEENKKYILHVLSEVKMEFNDWQINELNKLTGLYDLKLFKKENDFVKTISSNNLSYGEIKLFLYVVLFTRYIYKESILIIDEFSTGLDFETFLHIIKSLEIEAINNRDFQLFAINTNFFNKTKIYNSKHLNIFSLNKKSYGISQIIKDDNTESN